jgi:hypothetical protein
MLDKKEETTGQLTSLKAIKEQLISHFITIKQELERDNIPEPHRKYLLPLLHEISKDIF